MNENNIKNHKNSKLPIINILIVISKFLLGKYFLIIFKNLQMIFLIYSFNFILKFL